MQAIAEAEKPLSTELSFAEELLWEAELGEERVPFLDCARSLSLVMRFRGKVNGNALCAGLEAIIRRHSVLGSRISVRAGRPSRLYSRVRTSNVPMLEERAVESEAFEDVVTDLIKPEIERPFDLTQEPLVRAALVTLPTEEQILAICLHHIVSDRWSMHLLGIELQRLYNAYHTDKSESLAPLPAQYHDYVAQQRQHLNGTRGRKVSDYWINRLATLPPVILSCSTRNDRAFSTDSDSAWCTLTLDDATRLVVLSREHKTTLATTLLALFQLFLYRTSGLDEFVIGVPISDRRRPEFESLIGLFMNVVVVRTTMVPRMTFRDLLQLVRHNLVDACLNQDLPYGHLIQVMGGRPLYRVLFNFMPDLPHANLTFGGVQAERIPVGGTHQSLADLSLHVGSRAGQLLCRMLYKKEAFPIMAGISFAEQFRSLTRQVLSESANCLNTYHIAQAGV